MSEKRSGSRLVFLLAAIGLTAAAALPAAAEEVHLIDAVDHALAHNHNLAARGHALEATIWAHRQAKSQLLPSVSLQSNYTRLDDETVRRANAFGREITMFLPDSTGALQSVTIEIPQTVFRDGYETSVSAQLLLLNPSVWNGVSLAGASKEMAVWRMESTRQATAHRTVRAFLELLKIRSLLTVQEEHHGQAVKNVGQAARLYDVGRTAESDLLRWRVEEARQSGLLVELEGSRTVSALALEHLLGEPLPGGWEPDTLLPRRLAGEAARFRKMGAGDWGAFLGTPTDEVVRAHPEERILEISERIAELNHRQSKASFLPSVSVTGSYGWQNNDTPEPDGDLAWFASAALTFPLFTGFSNYSGLRSTKQKLLETREDIEEGRRGLRLAAESARSSIRTSAERLRLAGASLESARRNHEISQNSYALGRLTNLEWIDANLALQGAEQTTVSARYDLLLAIADYRNAAGEILELLDE